MRTKVVHLTSVHSPFDPRIFERECRSLAAAGYDVVVVAPHDGDATRNGIRIRGIATTNGRVSRMAVTTQRVLKVALSERGDIYHLHDPELLPVGLFLSTLGKRVIYDAHEDVRRDMLTKEYLPAPTRLGLAGVAAGLEGAASLLFSGIVAATPVIACRFPAAKAVTVQNFPRLEEFAGDMKPYGERPPEFIYVGSVTAVRGGEEMVRAMALLNGSSPAGLTLCGRVTPPDFASSLKTVQGWDRVDARGWCDPKGLNALFQRARAGLVILHPTRAYRDSYPGKMFEYMAAGLPVIASDFPLWRKIIDAAGAGILVDPLDPEAIASAMRWILEHPAEAEAMGKRGRAAVMQHYNWRAEESKLLALYERLSPSRTN